MVTNKTQRLPRYWNKSEPTRKNIQNSPKHITFCLTAPFNREIDEVDCFAFLGINPGEERARLGKRHLSLRRKPERYDFQAGDKRSKSSRNWYRRAGNNHAHKRAFIFAEMFFWSSKNIRELEKRYGKLTIINPHIKFCTKLNKALIGALPPSIPSLPRSAKYQHSRVSRWLEKSENYMERKFATPNCSI